MNINNIDRTPQIEQTNKQTNKNFYFWLKKWDKKSAENNIYYFRMILLHKHSDCVPQNQFCISFSKLFYHFCDNYFFSFKLEGIFTFLFSKFNHGTYFKQIYSNVQITIF